MRTRLLISFSGGETSAYMTQMILKHWRQRYQEIVIVFANTSQENEETLEFVDRCDRELFAPLGGRVVWIEGEQVHGARKPPRVRLVDFQTAARNGEVFEDFIRKYGIPNTKFKACTRSMKRKPIEEYAKVHLGWKIADYDIAIGIRADEKDRMSLTDERSIVYPLVTEWPTTKPQINSWFAAQPFRLNLKGYQGNCKTCWKKSFRKLMTIADESPEHFDFFRRMEREWGHHGPEFLKDPATRRDPLPPTYRRRFFRDSMTVDDLFGMLEERRAAGTFVPAEDDAAVYDVELDTAGGCGDESCEVWTEDSEDQLEEEA